MQINLLPQELQASPIFRNTIIVLLALVVFVGVPAGYYGYQLSEQVAALAVTNGELQARFATYQDITALVQERDTLVADVERALEAAGDHQQFSTTLFLDELAACMPTSVVVTEITLNPSDLSMQGSAKDYRSVVEFLGALVESEHFLDQPLLSYLTKGGEGYRFALSVKLVGGAAK